MVRPVIPRRWRAAVDLGAAARDLSSPAARWRRPAPPAGPRRHRTRRRPRPRTARWAAAWRHGHLSHDSRDKSAGAFGVACQLSRGTAERGAVHNDTQAEQLGNKHASPASSAGGARRRGNTGTAAPATSSVASGREAGAVAAAAGAGLKGTCLMSSQRAFLSSYPGSLSRYLDRAESPACGGGL